MKHRRRRRNPIGSTRWDLLGVGAVSGVASGLTTMKFLTTGPSPGSNDYLLSATYGGAIGLGLAGIVGLFGGSNGTAIAGLFGAALFGAGSYAVNKLPPVSTTATTTTTTTVG